MYIDYDFCVSLGIRESFLTEPTPETVPTPTNRHNSAFNTNRSCSKK